MERMARYIASCAAAVIVMHAAPEVRAKDEKAALLTVGAGGAYRPDAVDANWSGLAMIELTVPLRVFPVSLWLGSAFGYQRSNGASYDATRTSIPRETGNRLLGSFYAGLRARTRGTVYFHGGAGFLVGGIWSRSNQETTDDAGLTHIKSTVSSGPGIGGIATAGVGFDLRVLTLQADAFFLGAAAGDNNSFVGLGGRLMVGTTIF